jgi:hypothetical protein
VLPGAVVAKVGHADMDLVDLLSVPVFTGSCNIKTSRSYPEKCCHYLGCHNWTQIDKSITLEVLPSLPG